MCIYMVFFVPSLYQINATPLHVASEKGHHDVVQTLLGAGAEVNIAKIVSECDYLLLYLGISVGQHFNRLHIWLC